MPEYVVFVRTQRRDGGEGRYTGHVSAKSPGEAVDAVRDTLTVHEWQNTTEIRAIALGKMPRASFSSVSR